MPDSSRMTFIVYIPLLYKCSIKVLSCCTPCLKMYCSQEVEARGSQVQGHHKPLSKTEQSKWKTYRISNTSIPPAAFCVYPQSTTACMKKQQHKLTVMVGLTLIKCQFYYFSKPQLVFFFLTQDLMDLKLALNSLCSQQINSQSSCFHLLSSGVASMGHCTCLLSLRFKTFEVFISTHYLIYMNQFFK